MKMICLLLLLLAFPQSKDSDNGTIRVLEPEQSSDLPLFIYISGDGGWNSFNESLCKYLSEKGMRVIFLDAQKYFWSAKTPEETTAFLINLLGKYQQEGFGAHFVLAGYSFGATVVPFLVNRFPAPIKKNLEKSLLIAPDQSCDFEIHLTDMLNLGLSKGKYNVIQEIKQKEYKDYVGIFGSDDRQNNQKIFRATGIDIEILEGNHHFDSGFEALGDLVLKKINQ